MTHDFGKFISKAKKLGATDAKIIPAASIKTAAWVRMKCQFGCSGYGLGLCCPPHTPTPDQMQKVLDCFETALLIHCDADGDPTKIVVKLEREFFLAGYYKAFGMGGGPCFLCKKCNLEKCIHPDKTRPSMESCGIDVYETVRGNGFPLEVAVDEKAEVNYYGIVLIE